MQKKIKPGLISPVVDCFNIGNHEKRNTFTEALNIPSINQMHNTSTFLNSNKASLNGTNEEFFADILI